MDSGDGKSTRFGVGFWTLAFLMFSSLINLAMFTASLWVQVGYVQRVEFNAYKDKQEQRDEKRDQLTNDELRGIAKNVQSMTDSAPFHQKEEDLQNKRLDDLETRKRGN
jgi:hypothetical protein